MINLVKIIFRYLKKNFYIIKWSFDNHDKPFPIYTKYNRSGLKVHLGSGPINIQGWVNVDARAYVHVHLESNGFELREFVDGSISEIYLCHVLEHFSFEEAHQLLKGLKVKLCQGGIIRISVPSFDRLIDVYKFSDSDINKIKFALMGGQDYEYNFHKSLYNKKSLSKLLEHCGYSNVAEWETLIDFGVELGDWSNASFDSKEGPVRISLNLKGIN